MIDFTSMCIMTGCCMAIMIVIWVVIAFSDTKKPVKVDKKIRKHKEDKI